MEKSETGRSDKKIKLCYYFVIRKTLKRVEFLMPIEKIVKTLPDEQIRELFYKNSIYKY